MDIKALGNQAGTAFNRFFKQVEETVTNAETTTIQPDVQQSMNRSYMIERTCHKMIEATNQLLNPNPAARAENFIRDVFQAQAQNEKPNELEVFGQTLQTSGTNFGQETNMGEILSTVGQSEDELGKTKARFVKQVQADFCKPLQQFIDVDCKEAAEAREKLNNARLDLDAAKRRVKQAITAASKQSSKDNEELNQSNYENQLVATKTICDNHDVQFKEKAAPLFKAFAKAQAEYFEEAKMQADLLNNKLSSM